MLMEPGRCLLLRGVTWIRCSIKSPNYCKVRKLRNKTKKPKNQNQLLERESGKETNL